MTDTLFSLDWRPVLILTGSITEVIVRGTLMYLSLFALLRLILKRQSGGLAMTDVLVIVLIADAAQNGMANEYRSVTEGVVLVATIIFWSYALDWLDYYAPWFRTFFRPPPLLLVEDGKLMRRNMRQELMTALREQGISDLREVCRARMEADGRISVIKRGG